MLPQQRAVRGERGQDALRALYIDVARLSINCRARRGVAQVDGVAQVIVIEMLPELLAGFGVKTGHSFLQVGTLPSVAHRVELPVRDYGGRLPWKVSAPERVLRRNAVRQTGL